MCVHPGDPGKSVLSVVMLPGSGPWRCFWVLCSLARQLILSLYLSVLTLAPPWVGSFPPSLLGHQSPFLQVPA